MGKAETVCASLGIKILLSDLIVQMNEENTAFIRTMLEDGFIEDDNDYLNEAYQNVINEDNFDKLHLIKEFTLSNVFNQALLVPIKDILSTTRWGHDRYGTHGLSRLIDFDLLVDLSADFDAKIDKYSVVFILKQHSG